MSVKSMTGFARVRRELPEGELVVSLKSVNHRDSTCTFTSQPPLTPSNRPFVRS